jgi:hypothetical protein
MGEQKPVLQRKSAFRYAAGTAQKNRKMRDKKRRFAVREFFSKKAANRQSEGTTLCIEIR